MKRFPLISVAAAGFLALGVGGFAIAQQSPPQGVPHEPDGSGRHGPPPGMGMGPRPGGPFGVLEFDANGDGKLTKAEFDASFRTRFSEMDANKDGAVEPAEMRAWHEKQRDVAEAARFKILDTDGNGQISQAEFAAGREKGPGPGHRIAMRRGPGDDGPPGGTPGGPDGRRGDGPPEKDGSPRPAGPLDANRDGKLTLEEFTARTGDHFAQLDLNKDNVVTIAELQTTARAMR